MAYIVGRPEPVKFRVTCLPGEEEQLILAKKVLDRSGVREIEEKDLELNFTVVPEPLEKDLEGIFRCFPLKNLSPWGLPKRQAPVLLPNCRYFFVWYNEIVQ